LSEAGAALRYIIPIACVCDLFEGILLYLWNGELICKHQLRKEKPGAPQGNEHQLLFVSIPDTGGWLVVGS
jgi:hypothetical protein